MWFRYSWLTLLVVSLAVGPASAGVLEGNCRVANQPAATLLIPYFEVNVDDENGQTTLFSVNNASAKPALARVVLWTDWGVPTLAFDIYLTGFDVQSLNVRDLLRGTLPVTGSGVSNVGSLSKDDDGFASCSTAAVSANLQVRDQAWLRAAHTGRALKGRQAGKCAGSGRAGASVATGYITVDTVNRCTPPSISSTVNTPADPAYFADGGKGLASNSNVLWGDVYWVGARQRTANSQPAVHILADADVFSPGDYTFYGRYTGFDSRDNRAPLSSLYYARLLDDGLISGGTGLVVWRDNRKPEANPVACGVHPNWSRLGEMQLVAFDEEENPAEIPESNAFPLATQKVQIGSKSLPLQGGSGWILLDLWHRDGTHAQGWVGVVMTSEGRFSTGHAAIRADDLCNFGL
ncbi:MAG TPA: hypothetical protein VE685_14660 [Thermoanaerobaculia bacterium]|nr:hypothetical protein [Thermoanaerobaculia bacterium]